MLLQMQKWSERRRVFLFDFFFFFLGLVGDD